MDEGLPNQLRGAAAGGGAPAPGAHGGDGPRVARALGLDPAEVLDLSQSLNPVAPPVAPLVAAHLDVLDRYPDDADATAAMAEALGVEASRVLLTNGGAEAIALVAAEVGHGRVEDPEFSLYRRHLARVDDAGARFRSNPHSPSGRLAGPDERAAVWDEAFWPLATGTWSRRDDRDGAIVVGSLTKLFSCPGLRIGYVLAPDDATTDRLRARRPAWSVNGLALAVVPELLSLADLPAWSTATARLRDELVGVLRGHGFDPAPSDANWVLVDASGLREALLPTGVVVRDCTSFGLPGTMRIAVPDADGLARLDASLAATRP